MRRRSIPLHSITLESTVAFFLYFFSISFFRFFYLCSLVMEKKEPWSRCFFSHFYTNVYICAMLFVWNESKCTHARISTRKRKIIAFGIFHFQIARTSRHTMNIIINVIFHHAVQCINVFSAKTDSSWKSRENSENIVKILFIVSIKTARKKRSKEWRKHLQKWSNTKLIIIESMLHRLQETKPNLAQENSE